MAPHSLAGRNLVQAALTVSDLPRAIGFYRDTLGLPFLFETNGMAFFQLGNTRLMVGAGDGGASSGGVLYFDAPDLPELAAALEAKAISFLGPMQVLQKMADGDLCLRAFRDPDGNFLALMGVVPRATV